MAMTPTEPGLVMLPEVPVPVTAGVGSKLNGMMLLPLRPTPLTGPPAVIELSVVTAPLEPLTLNVSLPEESSVRKTPEAPEAPTVRVVSLEVNRNGYCPALFRTVMAASVASLPR